MTTKLNGFTPPKHLSATAAAHWRNLVVAYNLSTDTPALILLESALTNFDRAAQARKVIEKEGVCAKDRYNAPRAHPMLAVERTATALMIKALHELGLDLEPLNARPGRPPNR